jgi:hypothetical protein
VRKKSSARKGCRRIRAASPGAARRSRATWQRNRRVVRTPRRRCWTRTILADNAADPVSRARSIAARRRGSLITSQPIARRLAASNGSRKPTLAEENSALASIARRIRRPAVPDRRSRAASGVKRCQSSLWIGQNASSNPAPARGSASYASRRSPIADSVSATSKMQLAACSLLLALEAVRAATQVSVPPASSTTSVRMAPPMRGEGSSTIHANGHARNYEDGYTPRVNGAEHAPFGVLMHR